MSETVPSRTLRLVECPRDAMQGWRSPISTAAKIDYLNALLRVGFDTLDFGSFVSAKAIPQMADTAAVLAGLDLSGTRTKLLAIVANARGAEEAASHAAIAYLGFPFSLSETFQRRNTNSSIDESLARVRDIQSVCVAAGKELVVYLSMAFGNPYDDPWSEAVVLRWADTIASLGVRTISLADTVGLATPALVAALVSALVHGLPGVETGVHLHARPDGAEDKLDAAYEAGCRRFDSAMGGFGGCPMAGDELVGNIDTARLLAFLESKGETGLVDRDRFEAARREAARVFNTA